MCEIIKATEIAKAVGCTRHQVNYNIKNNVWNFGRTVKRGSKKKVREAIETFQGQVDWLKRIDDKGCEEARRCCIEYFEIAIEALEKQLPKKPIEKGIHFVYYKCPNCNRILPIDKNYCDCGQRLDWPEE